MLMKTKKIRKNLKIEKFEKTNKKKKKWSGNMVEKELPTKFGLDPCSGFPETSVYGRTDDGRLRHDSSSADKVKQS